MFCCSVWRTCRYVQKKTLPLVTMRALHTAKRKLCLLSPCGLCTRPKENSASCHHAGFAHGQKKTLPLVTMRALHTAKRKLCLLSPCGLCTRPKENSASCHHAGFAHGQKKTLPLVTMRTRPKKLNFPRDNPNWMPEQTTPTKLPEARTGKTKQHRVEG